MKIVTERCALLSLYEIEPKRKPVLIASTR